MRLTVLGAALLIAMAAQGVAALAQEARPFTGEQPFHLQSDEIVYDESFGVVTARGNVEVRSEGRVLTADTISYNTRTGIVTASGNIELVEPTGEVINAEYMQLDDELTAGFVESIRLLTAENARFSAERAERFPDESTELEQASYTPCPVCEEDPTRPPLWQLKAVRVIHDRKNQEVIYRDATLEVMGVPVAWVPYFTHADPTVKRKSGFLAPTVGSTSQIGLFYQQPYFFNLAPNRDATFAPIIATDENPILVGEYRARTQEGQYNLSGSLTYTRERDNFNRRLDDNEFRGHVFSSGAFALEERAQWGFQFNRATDDTYLNRYRFSDADVLTSTLYLEQFRGRDYAAAEAFSFQDLREESDPGMTPLVAPLLQYGWSSAPLWMDSRFELDANLVSLYRTEGRDTRRLSTLGRWQLPWLGPLGDAYTLTAQLRADSYWLQEHQEPGAAAQDSESGFEARVRPLLALDWRYPFVRTGGQYRQVLEPIVQGIVTPYGGNDGDIPNEDSLTFEFDDTNLFSLNRFPGYDRYESGPRLNYGMRYAIYGPQGGSVSALLGQVIRLKDDDTFAPETGLDHTSSDYVARLTVAPSQYLDLTTRVRIDRDDLSLKRNEIYLAAGPPWLRVIANYVRIDRDLSVDELDAREELFLATRMKLAEHWSFSALTRRDLRDDGGQIRTGFSIGYDDECIGFLIAFDRDFTRDRDVEPSTSVSFRIVLKTLS